MLMPQTCNGSVDVLTAHVGDAGQRANYASAMVPLWKRVLSRAITVAIRAEESPKRHRRPDVPLPTEDSWYESHEVLDTIQPGTLLAHRPVEFRAGSHWVSHARAWQLRYRSTDTMGQPISAVATLMVPERAWAGEGPRPLVSYQGAIDSLGPRADPSYTFRKGSQKEFLLMALALRHGWAVVTPDFTGPRHAFGAGLIAARITLDGIRAAFGHEPADLSPAAPVAMWGYSGGGQATAWAAEQHPLYAPEIRLAAVAAGGVPTDNRSLYRIDGGLLSGFALGAWVGISREYPQTNLLADANEQGRRVVEEIADMTVEELIAYFPCRRLGELTTVADAFATEGALIVNDQLALGRRLPSAPIYLYHAIHDQLVPIVEADDLAATYRRGGVDVTLKRSHLGEHILFHRFGANGVLHYLTSRLETPPQPTDAPAGPGHAEPSSA
jgi:pimeloyl-ACP methyl ester carboxylesterase